VGGLRRNRRFRILDAVPLEEEDELPVSATFIAAWFASKPVRQSLYKPQV